MSLLSEKFNAPAAPAIARTFQRMTGVWTMLATVAALLDHRDRLLIWSIGRPAWVAQTPYALAGVLIVCGAAMALRRAAFVAGLCAFATMATLNGMLPFAYHNNHYLLSLFVVIVTLGNRWPDTAWTARMLRLQLATVYLVSVVVKLCHPWWSGTGRVIAWAVDHHAPASNGWFNTVIGAALQLPHVPALTDTTITTVEAMLPFALFSRRWRGVALAVAIAMHCTMQEWLFPQMFTFLMLLGLHAFGPLDARTFRVRFRAEVPSERWLSEFYPRIDWFERTAWEAGAALSITGSDGLLRSGADALRLLALLTPVPLAAYAAFALLLPLPRLENTLLALGLVMFAPLALSSARGAVSLPH